MKKTLLLLLALLFCTPANAQTNPDSLRRWYVSPEGVRPAIFADGFESGNTSALFDFSDDVTSDIVMSPV